MKLYEKESKEFFPILDRLELTREEYIDVVAIVDMTDEIPTSDLVRKEVIRHSRDELDEFYILITMNDFNYESKMIGRTYVSIQPYYFWLPADNTLEEVEDFYEFNASRFAKEV